VSEYCPAICAYFLFWILFKDSFMPVQYLIPVNSVPERVFEYIYNARVVVLDGESW
jgi:hypothetical protein